MAPSVRRLALLPLFAALAACTGDATQPSRLVATGEGPAITLFDPPILVSVLQRTTPLLGAARASASIGPEGGRIAIPVAGFAIDFPAGAIEGGPRTITVTALPGTSVAYLFEPHGLVFQNDPVITQDLRSTEAFQNTALRGRLEGAYFPALTDLLGATARIRETRPTVVEVDGERMKFTVHHFSGYVASSRRTGYIGSSGNRISAD